MPSFKGPVKRQWVNLRPFRLITGRCSQHRLIQRERNGFFYEVPFWCGYAGVVPQANLVLQMIARPRFPLS
jgi:hypothetical protein